MQAIPLPLKNGPLHFEVLLIPENRLHNPLLPSYLELSGFREHRKQIECLKKYCFRVLMHMVGARYTEVSYNQRV